MHEMSLCEGIIQVLEEQAQQQNFSTVSLVVLEIGALAGVEKEALRFGFDVVTKGTLAEAATLEIVDLPATAWCFACEMSVPVSERFDCCPQCSGHQLQVNGGDEMRIKELEVE